MAGCNHGSAFAAIIEHIPFMKSNYKLSNSCLMCYYVTMQTYMFVAVIWHNQIVSLSERRCFKKI